MGRVFISPLEGRLPEIHLQLTGAKGGEDGGEVMREGEGILWGAA